MPVDVHYEIVIAWSANDHAYVARVPELAGCMAHGATYGEALANIQEAMSLWLVTAIEDKIALPEPHLYATAGA